MAAQRIGLAGVAVVSDLMDEHIDSGSRCDAGHPLMLVAEGYAYCSDEDGRRPSRPGWWPWRLAPPSPARAPLQWTGDLIRGRDGEPVQVWRGPMERSLAEALAFIQEDMDSHRGLPYDEDRERARLRPV